MINIEKYSFLKASTFMAIGGKRMKFFKHCCTITFIFIFVFALACTSPEPEGDAPYRIGVNLELTGPYANITKTLVMAMEMEVERVNEMGGINGHPLELVIEDNGFDLAKVSSNMLKFAQDKSILAVVGPFEDNFQATTRDIAEKEKITNIIVCPSNPNVRELNQKWAFNIAQNDLLVSGKLVDLCTAREYKKVLIFPGNWPLAMSLAQDFKQMAAEKGIQAILSEETHKPTDIDMTPQLIKMKPIIESENIDAFYACTGGPPGPIICKNMRTLGIKTPILGTHAFGFGFIIGIGQDAVEGVEFPAGKPVVPYQLDENDPVRDTIVDFNERMLAKYKQGADQVSGHGYDIVWLIHDAIKGSKKPGSREAFRDALESTKEFKGCTGVYNYSPSDHDGLNKNDLVFVRIEDHKFKRIKFPEFE